MAKASLYELHWYPSYSEDPKIYVILIWLQMGTKSNCKIQTSYLAFDSIAVKLGSEKLCPICSSKSCALSEASEAKPVVKIIPLEIPSVEPE